MPDEAELLQQFDRRIEALAAALRPGVPPPFGKKVGQAAYIYAADRKRYLVLIEVISEDE